MKKITMFLLLKTLLLGFVLTKSANLQAQAAPGTQDDNFLVQIKSPASIAQLLSNTYTECGWVGSTYGPSVTAELCGEVVWAEPDSLGCSALTPGSLTGKIALIRRGTCDFSAKVYKAQQAGAKAVIVANHYNNPDDGDCFGRQGTLYFGGMAGGVDSALVTIPSVFIQRQTAALIADALAANQKVDVCFVFPRLTAAYAEYTYASPASQTQVMNNIALNFVNRETEPITNMTVSAAITEPSGNVSVVSTLVPEITVGADTLIFINGYTPPAEEGEFNVALYTDRYSEDRDTLHRKFVQTQYTFAIDNLTLLPGQGLGNGRPDLFATDLQYAIGALAFAGDAGGVATYGSFGIDNIDSVYVPDNEFANTLTVLLSKFDADGNGRTELAGDFSDLELVGTGVYVMKGNEKPATLIDAGLYDLISGNQGITLSPNTIYVLAVLYDGTENGSGRPIGFSNSAQVNYLAYLNEAGTAISTTPARIGGNISSWSGATAALRLQLEGYIPIISTKPNLLDASKYAISPNPASTSMALDLSLSAPSPVQVTIANPMGQVFYSQLYKDFQNGKIALDVKNIPSGNYVVVVKTKEGVGVKQVAICH